MSRIINTGSIITGLLFMVSFCASGCAVYEETDPQLSSEELSGLKFMWEEEKLARDTYNFFYEKWDHKVFSNIAASEQRHMDAIRVLLDKYDGSDSDLTDSPGVFSIALLQDLYDTLELKGSADIMSAFMAGALIEETDIMDIQKELIHNVSQHDVRYTYEQLMKGSRNHLRAFTRNLTRYGIDYAPQVMDEAQYADIINSSWERGRK